MNVVWEELAAGFPEAEAMARITVRLIVAMIFGAVIGIQRERAGKPAGLRTHMLVALGAAVFVIASGEFGMNPDSISRVIQGLVTGIGFLGAGAILKLYDKRAVEGLTTAAGIWMTAALGVAVGLGRFGLALVATLLAWMTLSLVRQMEHILNRGARKSEEDTISSED
ncbi:MAG: putative Mg(2+) transporter [Deltaproteobacteria bacterium]|jgi:putative Mg2+ transporter-C (MgtC) family protein|nr:putative Mg(2+) transporter [Deltaproteobacteria bacterium]